MSALLFVPFYTFLYSTPPSATITIWHILDADFLIPHDQFYFARILAWQQKKSNIYLVD